MGDAQPTSDPTHLYCQARAFFAAEARDTATPADGIDRTDDLVDALLGLFKLVVIDLDENDDAQVIFEVLNGRQTPLSASDLVKNLIFLRGELTDEAHLEELYDKYWADFDNAWWKTQTGTGHAARDRRDVVLSVWLTATTGRDTSVARLYGEVRQYLNSAERKIEELLAELQTFGHAYKVIYAAEPAEDDRLARSYANLDRLRITTAIPLLAWLRTLPAALLPADAHVEAVVAVESWAMRRMITGVNTRGYGAGFLIVLNKAQEAARTGADVTATIVRALADAPNQLGWPDDDAIAQSFRSTRFYGSFTQERIRLLLGSIDQRLREENPKTEPATFAYDGLQIEHVMPQSWREHWALDAANPSAEALAAAERDAAVQRLGNLTLVTSTFNQSVSNLGWQVKKAELQKQSALQLNGSIASHDEWDETAIAERADHLATIACQIWPSPTTCGAS